MNLKYNNVDLSPSAPRLADDSYTPMPDVIRALRHVLGQKYGHGEAEAMIRLIFHHLKGWTAADMIINENRPVSAITLTRIREIVGRLMNDEPIQYIVGNAHFFGMDFIVEPGVLIPRPETEELVDMIINSNRRSDLKILDACTGSGCIAIALARNLPFSVVTAVDNSKSAISVARKNATKLNTKIEILEQDIHTYDPAPDSFDIIVSNPPYVDEKEKKDMEANVLDYEPAEALFVSDDNPLVFYDRIAEIGCKALVPGGRIYFEINPNHSDDMKSLLERKGYTAIHSLLDIHGKRRFMSAIKPKD